MSRANRNFSSTPQTQPSPCHGFNPGGDDFGVVRIVDGHDPYETGSEGSNVHVPSSSTGPGWDDAAGVPVEDC